MSSSESIYNVFFTPSGEVQPSGEVRPSGETPQSQVPTVPEPVPEPVPVPEQTVPTVPEQTVPVTTQELCPSCYSIYPADSEWSDWVLRGEREREKYFCSIFCADHIQCSECEQVLGRIPWAYKPGLYETRLCSHDCYLEYCRRMKEEYPDSDDDKEPEVNIDEI